MKAVIKKYRHGEAVETLAEVSMVDGAATVTGNAGLKKEIEEWGIIGRMGRTFTLADGENFILELPYAIAGSFVRAEVVEE